MAAPVPSSRALWLSTVWMLLAVGAVAAAASVDAEREAAAALADFGEQQHALAHALLSAALLAPPMDASGLLAHLQVPPGHRRLLVELPRASGFVDPEGRPVLPSTAASAVQRAFDQGRDTLILSRDESASLGMARRTSAVGLTRAVLPGGGEVRLALVSGAERDRDRARRTQWRVLAAIGIAVALVGTFGGLAMRRQRTELTLARELAGAEAAHERDERLNRLDRSAVMLTLAAGLAHEIGTPLAVIQGRAEQLRARPGLDERTTSSLSTISTQVQHIQDVVQGFLHLARGGSMSLSSAAPAEVMASAHALVEHRFEGAGVHLSVEPLLPSGQAAPPIRCNRLLLEHALTNLLLNARDACVPGGTVRLSVEPAGGRQEGQPAAERLALVVTDDGEGIPPELASRVTEAFFSTKPEGKGTGLGLAIATEIAKLHHGTLTLYPHAPRGTRVVIEVPHG